MRGSFEAQLPLNKTETFISLTWRCVAGALKQYLRELPEPLMTFKYYDEWIQAARFVHRLQWFTFLAVVLNVISCAVNKINFELITHKTWCELQTLQMKCFNPHSVLLFYDMLQYINNA